jgi:hypothetical protein
MSSPDALIELLDLAEKITNRQEKTAKRIADDFFKSLDIQPTAEKYNELVFGISLALAAEHRHGVLLANRSVVGTPLTKGIDDDLTTVSLGERP